MSQMKTKQMNSIDLLNTEFKILLIRMLMELSENFNKERVNIKRIQKL